jgi:hypothetical protein
MQPTSSLSYGSIEAIRKGVEDLGSSEKGVIPSCAAIARCARQLESHAASQYCLENQETSTGPGPVFSLHI